MQRNLMTGFSVLALSVGMGWAGAAAAQEAETSVEEVVVTA